VDDGWFGLSTEAERVACCVDITTVKTEHVDSSTTTPTTVVRPLQQQVSPPASTARSCDVTVTSSPVAACSPPAALNIAHGQCPTIRICSVFHVPIKRVLKVVIKV